LHKPYIAPNKPYYQNMKVKIILSALILLSIDAFSQSRNNISVVYGIAANTVDIHGVIGDFGYSGETGRAYGLSYTRDITRVVSLETGLLFSVNNVRLSTIQGGRGDIFYNGDVKLISVPLYARINFLKYLFAQGGFLIDHQTNYTSNHVVVDQSGVGFGMGFGGKYSFGALSVFINPYFCRHAINARYNLMEGGARFGVGYNF
jgi:hypothetical protein